MNKKDIEVAIHLIDAIDKDWAVCDEKCEDDFMVLVNEDREEMKGFHPSKALVISLEKDGLIELDTERSDKKGVERRFDKFLDETYPISFVFMYKVTEKGRQFYARNQ